jgi:hypothetical protein
MYIYIYLFNYRYQEKAIIFKNRTSSHVGELIPQPFARCGVGPAAALSALFLVAAGASGCDIHISTRGWDNWAFYHIVYLFI